ncbi:peptide/nickel transport system ATP-binding protein [Salana multivorans]|uniref:Peptide/nickel transport system ATP-binding protein n=1 Tax=Salana multivorans TaxID=120377 RepID=A0A3N2DAR4_9MICO|nr:ABC transporter ATP-binding protein [Salana multivorans]MBN8881091.1 ABC transporter ATP-binding protein [Salana multivorans]OJX95433.1 MAG: ABC transporter ATP-binding protein [Micrococcales bacterium 73-15]ROR96534.1 peptide/nickel transport system ATP-binding protein [Salana multivorans]
MSALVRVRGLTVSFPGTARPAVDGLDLDIEPGEIVAIVGESGSGKSVTARSLVGLAGEHATVRATELTIDGVDARNLSDRAWRRLRGRSVGLVLQDALVSLDPLRRVGAEIGESLRRVLPGLLARGRRRERAIALLGDVGVPNPAERIDAYPHELSGGLRQRALIASALAASPALLVADEPTTALDVTVQAQILQLLARLRDSGTALLLISHDLAVVSAVADRILVMKDGLVVERGSTARVLAHPEHPYTRRLLAAVPSSASRGVRLSSPDRLPAPERRPGDRVVVAGRGLVVTYPIPGGGTRHALAGVDVELREGEVLGVVGESGSGKSTLARVLLGLHRPEEGEVRRPAERLEMQLVAQDPLSSFDPRYTVREVIAEPLRERGRLDRAGRREGIDDLLRRVGLAPEHADRHPRTLSGGQRQRVAIARALAADPSVIVADEPVSALDVSIQAQVLDLLTDLAAERGLAILFISHDLGVVHHLADRIVVMKDGHVVESGDVEDVFHRPSHPYTRRLLVALPDVRAAERAEPDPSGHPLAAATS